MKTSLIRIGNSQGVRIPKTVIEQCGFKTDVEMSVQGNSVMITAARKPRSGWEEAFQRMRRVGDDTLLIPDSLPNEFDDAEWNW